MDCPQCQNDPCTCQRALVVPQEWLLQECSSPDCHVMIRSRVGQQEPGLPVCKWCRAGTAYYRVIGAVKDATKCPPAIPSVLLAPLWTLLD